MKTYKTIIISVLVLFLGAHNHSLYSQTDDDIRKKTYLAYVKGELGLWEDARDRMEQLYREKQDPYTLYDLLMVQYGYAAFCAKEKYKERGLAIIEEGMGNVSIYLDSNPDDPGALALKAAFMVFEANLVPAKMLGNGAESIKISEKAYLLDEDNLLALTGKANQLRFTPAIFGGSVDESIPLYEKIISNYESGLYQKQNDWIYVNTMVILAGTYEKKKMFDKACEVYEEIIGFDSDINWIRNGLYPECLKKAGRDVEGQNTGNIAQY